MMTEHRVCNVHDVLESLAEHWSPRTVAVVNDYDVRVVKVQGEFTRHSHPETDEFFLVLSGELTIRMDDGNVVLSAGDSFVVPQGRFHQLRQPSLLHSSQPRLGHRHLPIGSNPDQDSRFDDPLRPHPL
jgi:mannose-6-phosphate isomerase-like protein (cupin superfamily)